MTKFLVLITVFFTSNAWAQTAPSDVVDMTNSDSAKLTLTTPAEKKSAEQQEAEEELKDQKLQASNGGKNIEKIQVTGSYIRRIDTEGPSPMVVVDKEDFEKAAVDTITDYLREDPLFSGSTEGGDRAGYFRFHGQHAGSTLVMLNGMRVPKLGGPSRGFYNGVKSIPTNVVERVEILKDGSSALYGSDAMAGVMNFITKKDYDGADFSTRVNVPEIGVGVQQNHNLSFGKNYSRGNWFASVQYVKQSGYDEADVRNDWRVPTTGPASFATINPDNQKSSAIRLNCSPDPDKPGKTICPPQDNRSIDRIRDPNENIGALVTGRIDLSSSLSLNLLGMYNRNSRTDVGRPRPITYSEAEGGKANLSSLGGGLKAASNGATFGELSIYPYDEVGLSEVRSIDNSYSTQAKLEGFMGDTWSWNVSGAYAYSREDRSHLNGLVNKDLALNALQAGHDFDKLGQSNSAFDSAKVTGTEAYEASMTSARFLTTGELFDFQDLYNAGGPFSIAVGVEGQWETTNDDHDDLLIQQNLNRVFDENQFGSRAVTSAFVELVSYPLQELEVQLAGRYDKYSDFGDTFNPKVSLGYRPSNKALIRGSWGTNFNAPSVRNMIQRDYVDYDTFYVCGDEQNDRCDTVAVNRYRDKNLKEEIGTNYNLGMVLQPNKSWTFTVDQWNFEGKDTLANLSGSAYSRIFEAVGEEGLEDAGVTLVRDAEGNLIGASAPAVTNTGKKTIRGLDIKVNVRNRVRLFGKVLRSNFQSSHSHFLLYRDQRSPSAPIQNRPDLEWKNTTSGSLSTRLHSYRLAARTLAGDTGARTSTRTHTEYDFNYGFKLPWGGRFSTGVKNLLNSRPPVDQSGDFIDYTAGFNAYAFQALGRRYYMGYSQTF